MSSPRPRPRAVALGSIALFAVLFVLLTFQLAARASSPGAELGGASAKPRPAAVEAQPEPEEPLTSYAEPGYEYAEPGPEPEPEVEVEEIPPVITSSS